MSPPDRDDPTRRPAGPDATDESGVRAALLVALLDDRERGERHDVGHYQRRFPGFEALVAAEFAAFEAGGEPAGDDGMPERYRRQGELGRGGMGVVYRVVDPGLQRQLALKRARPGATEGEHARFLEEARITAQLDHPGVVPVHELGLDEHGAPYFTMQMVRGRTFAEVIAELHREAPAERWRRVVGVLLRVCDTIAFAHSRGVVHRDLKPQNVMVGRFGEVYVMDWGLARASGRSLAATTQLPEADPDEVPARDTGDTPQWTLVGDVMGTPSYLAPEQLLGPNDADGRTDIYALGAMLYHALAGRAPYDDGESDRPILDRLCSGPPTPLARLAPDAPAELVAICTRAMARAAEDRYADVEALRDDLRRFDAGHVVRAYERGTWAELRKWVARNRAVTISAAAAVLALVIGLVVSLLQRARADDEAVRAEASFRDSVAAVDRMLSRVGSETLENVPQTAAIRRQLLEDATGFFDRFLAERPDDLALHAQAAGAHYRVGRIRLELGDHDAGFAALRRSLELASAGRRRQPGDRVFASQIAQAHFQLGSSLTTLGRYDDARAELLTAQRESEALLEGGRDRLPLALAGSVRDALALVAWRTRRLDDAAAHAEASVALRTELVERFGDGFLGALGTPHGLLAGVHMARRDLEAARDELQLAARARRRHYELQGDDDEARAQLAETLNNLAGIQHALRADDDAARCIDEAVALRATNAAREPGIAENHNGLAAALAQQAKIRRETGDPQAAAEALRRAAASIERAIEIDPGTRAWHDTRLGVEVQRYHTVAQLSRFDELQGIAEAMAADDVAGRRAKLDAAHQICLWARIAARAGRDEAHARELSAPHVAAALLVLRALADAGQLRDGDLEHDALDPIRDAPGFAELDR